MNTLFRHAAVTFLLLTFCITTVRPQWKELSIPLPVKTPELAGIFNKAAESEPVYATNKKGKQVKAYATRNLLFIDEVLAPNLLKYEKQLKALRPQELVNALTLYIFRSYQLFIGKSFYRWGGDILDLDDAQYESPRYQYSYGLDCSGFSASGYELAVHLGLLSADSPYALFSSQGLKRHAEKTGFKLRGALKGGNNKYRWDTVELNEAGTVVFSLAKAQKPTEEQLAMLQPGDMVGMNGHFGVIAFIDGKPMYVESGGWALSKNNEEPIPAMRGLTFFANHAAISVRRAH